MELQLPRRALAVGLLYLALPACPWFPFPAVARGAEPSGGPPVVELPAPTPVVPRAGEGQPDPTAGFVDYPVIKGSAGDGGTYPFRTAPACPPRPRVFDRAKREQRKCARQEHLLGYPEEFQEVPFGASLHAHGRTQVGKGAAARMVLYEMDFLPGRAELNPAGGRRLMRIASLATAHPGPILIDGSCCAPALAEARRAVVLQGLAHGHAPISPDRVVVGRPLAPGLSGLEAELIYRRLLIQTQAGGALGPVGGVATGGGGGFGGSSR